MDGFDVIVALRPELEIRLVAMLARLGLAARGNAEDSIGVEVVGISSDVPANLLSKKRLLSGPEPGDHRMTEPDRLRP